MFLSPFAATPCCCALLQLVNPDQTSLPLAGNYILISLGRQKEPAALPNKTLGATAGFEILLRSRIFAIEFHQRKTLFLSGIAG